jgi:hypothetical protein
MTRHDRDDAFDREFERRFPREAEWLDQPWPQPWRTFAQPAVDDDRSAGADGASAFVERVLGAWREELDAENAELDRLLAEQDADWPSELFLAHAAPEPAPDFAARTVRAARDDRQHRWQQLLAQYVAPAPSAAFVARTLAALQRVESGDEVPLGSAPPRRTTSALRRLAPGLALAAAAALLLWLRPTTNAPPLEVRVTQHLTPAHAAAHTASPLGAILATAARHDEPLSLPLAADGLWLLTEEVR